jgi:DNA repair protein RecO (recombination protein O)
MHNKNAFCKLMLHKTRGIVLRSTEYGETSLVVKIYTELHGIKSFLINSVRKKHAKVHSNIFQPLTPVDLVIYYKDRPGLQRISDIRPNPPLANIPFDISKSSMIFFLDEVLIKSIHEEEANPSLFDFIFNSIMWLDGPHPAGNDFHLLFLIQLSRHLGFYPQNNYEVERNIFNLREGLFQSSFPDHPHFIPPPLSFRLSELITADYSFSLTISSTERRALISLMLEYFALHIEGFGTMKSHKVLEEVWNDE